MTGADQHCIDVLVQLQVFLVECDLPIGRLRFSEFSHRRQTVGAEVSENVLNPV